MPVSLFFLLFISVCVGGSGDYSGPYELLSGCVSSYNMSHVPPSITSDCSVHAVKEYLVPLINFTFTMLPSNIGSWWANISVPELSRDWFPGPASGPFGSISTSLIHPEDGPFSFGGALWTESRDAPPIACQVTFVIKSLPAIMQLSCTGWKHGLMPVAIQASYLCARKDGNCD